MRIISNGKVDPGTVISEKDELTNVNPVINLPPVSEHKEEPQISIPMELLIKSLDELNLIIDGLGSQYEIMELKRKLEVVEGLVKDKHNVIETLLLGGLKATYELNKLRDEMKTIRAKEKLGEVIGVDNSIATPANKELNETGVIMGVERIEEPEAMKADGTIITPPNITHLKKCDRCGAEKHYRAFAKNVNICRKCGKMIANKVKNE